MKNISLSGQSLQSIDTLLSKAVIDSEDRVKSIVVHIGTNDVVKSKSEEIIEHCKLALSKVNSQFPSVPVAFSSILPRRGSNQSTNSLNEQIQSVNRYVLFICKETPFLHYVDNDQLIFNEGKFQKSLYDARDPIDVHLSDEDALELYNQFCCFFYHGESDELQYEQTPSTDRKRKTRGSNSDEPPSAGLKTKQGRSDNM